MSSKSPEAFSGVPKTLTLVMTFLSLALGPESGGCYPPLQDDAEAMTLVFAPLPVSSRHPGFVFKGNCGLPDYATITLVVSRITESAKEGPLQSFLYPIDEAKETPKRGRFEYELAPSTPGRYYVSVRLLSPLFPEDKRREWNFEFSAWDDEFIAKLSTMLTQLQSLTTETKQMIEKFEAASADQREWDAKIAGLFEEGAKLQKKLREHPLRPYYPAAVGGLFDMMKEVVSNQPNYTFTNGRCDGPKDLGQPKRFRKEDLTWTNLKRHIDGCLRNGGSEFCLWVLRDLNRTSGKMRPDVLDSIAKHKTSPGVDRWHDQLREATAADIPRLEAAIRTSY